MPTSEERRSLRLGLGTPVVELRRISYTDDRPIEDFCSSMAGNSHAFAYEFDAPE